MIAQSLIEKGMLEGMTLSVSAITESLTSGGWVWVAIALGVFFIYKRFSS